MNSKFLFTILFSFFFISYAFSQSGTTPSGKGLVSVTEEDSSPDTYPWQLKFPNSSLTDNSDGTVSFGYGGSDLRYLLQNGSTTGATSQSQIFTYGISISNIYPSGDSDDYFTLDTASNIPTIYGTGAYTRFGDASTTANSLNSEDDVLVTGELECGSNLYSGLLQFTQDSGLVDAFDMPVSDTPDDNTVEGYNLKVDGNAIMTIYSQADSSGAVDTLRVGINNTAPSTTLHVKGSDDTTSFNLATFDRYTATPADNDAYDIIFNHTDDSPAQDDFARIRIKALDVSNGTESGEFAVFVADGVDGSLDNALNVRLGVTTISGGINYAADAGSNDSYSISIPNIAALTTGMVVYFYANTANTGACTLDIDGAGALTAKALKSLHDQDPADNYIEAGSMVHAIYDGTNFQILNPDANP